MSQFYVCMAATLLIAYIAQHTCVYTHKGTLQPTIERPWPLLLIFCILTLFIGLRTSYNDTAAYRAGYENTQPFPEFWDTIEFGLGEHNGFTITNAALKTLGVSTQGFLLFYAVISVALSLYILKKYSCNFTVSLFLFFTTNVYFMPAAAVKQYVAIVIGLLAIPYMQKRKWIPFTLIIILASLFHPYALMYFIMPFLQFKPWSKWTYILLLATVIIGFTLESLFDTIINITTMIGKEYTEDDLYGSGINIFRVLVCNIPLVLSFLCRHQIAREASSTEYLMLNLAMVNGAIMFIGSFGTAIYFSRLANYFTIAQCVVLPYLIRKLPVRQNLRQIVMICMIIGYMGFFIYANQVFSHSFSRTSLFQYLSSLA